MRDVPDEWKPLPMPEECFYLWEWFVGMREQNGDDFTSGTMKAWFDLQGIHPMPFEVRALSNMMMALHKSREVAHGTGKTGTTGGQPPGKNR